MIASNVNRSTLEEAAAKVGVTVDCTATSDSGRRFRVKVTPGELGPEGRTPKGYRRKGEVGDTKYQRTSAAIMFHDDRRVHAVCWHGFRDFFRACFAIEPEAKFYTAMDSWLGSEDFEERYRSSGHRNIGSMMAPCHAAEACRCPESGMAV